MFQILLKLRCFRTLSYGSNALKIEIRIVPKCLPQAFSIILQRKQRRQECCDSLGIALERPFSNMPFDSF